MANMLVSVTERTREIAAHGGRARSWDILWYRVEAMVLCPVGGESSGLQRSRLVELCYAGLWRFRWRPLLPKFPNSVGIIFGFTRRKASRLTIRRCATNERMT
jgi:hypothetical protein